MTSLTTSIKKAGASLPEPDKIAILDASRRGRADGLSAADAARAAVQAQIDAAVATLSDRRTAVERLVSHAQFAAAAMIEAQSAALLDTVRTEDDMQVVAMDSALNGVVLDSAALDKADQTMLQKSNADKVDTRGPVSVFSEGDKIISLDDNKDYTVTGQRGYKVSVKGRSEPFHANRLKLASGKKPPTIVMDDAEPDAALDGVEELPGLRAQLATATSTMERLRLAQAIKAARVAPPAPPPAPADNDASRVNALKRLMPKDDIRSDDPQLIEKLTAKVNYLTAFGDFMRKANKLFRKIDNAGMLAMGMTEAQIASMSKPDFAGRTGFPDYMMSNNNGVLSATRKRLEAALRDREPPPPPVPQDAPVSLDTIRLLAEPLGIAVDSQLATHGGAVEYAGLKLGAAKGTLEWMEDAGQYEMRGRTDDGASWKTGGNRMSKMLGEFAAWAKTVQPALPPSPAGRFRYAMVNRPADLGAIPKVLYTVEPRPPAGQPHHDTARHGILVTERELTAQEVKAFELAPLVDDEDLAALASKVAESMTEYAAGHLEMAAEEPDYMRRQVMQTVERSSSGIRYSIGDPALLVQMVVDKLKAGVPAKPEPTPPPPGPIPPEPPAADTARADDLALLSLVASGKHPNMLEPELADEIEAVLARHASDKVIQDLGERAIVAYSNGLMAATGG